MEKSPIKTVMHILEAVEGGTWQHLTDLIGGMNRERFSCTVALSFERGRVDGAEAVSTLESMGAAVYQLTMKRRIAPIADLRALVQLVLLLRRVKPDVIHVHSSKAGLLGRVAARLCNVPVVYTPHAFAFLMTQSALRRSFYQRLERAAVRLTSAVICLSCEEVAAAAALGYCPAQIHMIPNGIKLEGVRPLAVREGGKLRVGFFGRSAWQKGDDTFVRLVAALLERGAAVEGHMYGIAPDSPQLLRLIHQAGVEVAVRLCGSCAPAEVVERMRDLDVIVMPSRWEGLPYVLLEAWLAGVPVAAYATGGIKDVVVHGESGLLAAPEDFKGLTACVMQLQDATLRLRLAEGGRLALREFGLPRMIEQTEGVYALLT